MPKMTTIGEIRDVVNGLNVNSISFEEREKQLKIEKEYEEQQRKVEKNSPYKRWTQYNNEHTQELIWLALNHPKAHAILLFLVDQMDNYNAIMCSYQVLQEVLNVSKDTIRLNIKVLKENGFIAVVKSGTSNVYAVNDSIYWKSWGNKRKYSKFPVNVILALSEQDKEYQSKIAIEKHKEIVPKPKKIT